MACSKYVSTKETTNMAYVVRLLLDPCSDMLRDVLRNYITESTFPAKLKNDALTIKPLLNASQRALLYPQHGTFLGTYQDLDLSLLYLLLRNITGIPKHAKGWGLTPNAGDRSISANIERIRNIRNTYLGHINQSSMPDSTFHSVWKEVRNIASELVKDLALTTNYVSSIDKLEHETMDREQEQAFLEKLDVTEKTIEELTDQQEKQRKILTNQVDTQNNLHEVQHQHGVTIVRHEELLNEQGQTQTEHGSTIVKHEKLITQLSQVQTEQETTIHKHKERVTELGQVQTEQGTTIVKHEELLNEQGKTQTDHESTIFKHEELITELCQVQTEQRTTIVKHEEIITELGQVQTEYGSTIVKHEELLTEQCQTQTQHESTIVKHEDLITEIGQKQTAQGATIVKHEELLTEQGQVQTEHGTKLKMLSSSVYSLSREAGKCKEQAKDEVARNILDNTKAVLKNHGLSKTYFRTRQVDAVIQRLREERIVILTGKPGDGKTTIAKQVLRELSQNDGRVSVIITEPYEWNRVVNSNNKMAVYVDDMFGSTNVDTCVIDKWKNKFDLMISCAKEGQIFILISSRKNILAEVRKSCHERFLNNPENEINLTSNKLTSEEKRDMLLRFDNIHKYRASELIGDKFRKHEKKNGRDAVYKLTNWEKEIIISSEPYYGFPQTCVLFFTRKDFFQLGKDFFLRPNRTVFENIDDMRKSTDVKSKLQYCTLAYVFLNGNIHTRNVNEDTFQEICEKSSVSKWTEVDIEDAVQDLAGIYLSPSNKKHVYAFCHETIREAVAASFGKLAPYIAIQKCSDKTIHELIRTEAYEEREGEVVLTIRKNFYILLAHRLLTEDTGYGIYHPATDDPAFTQVLFDVINRSPENSRTIISKLWKKLEFNDKPVLYREIMTWYGPHRIKHKAEYDNNMSVDEHNSSTSVERPYVFTCGHVKTRLDDLLFRGCKQSVMNFNRYAISNFDVNYFLDSLPGFIRDVLGMSVLHCCVARGWVEIVDEILSVVTPTKMENGWSCLHFAAFFGRFELFKTFEKLSSNVLETTRDGYNIFHLVLLGLRHRKLGPNTHMYFLEVSENYFNDLLLLDLYVCETSFRDIFQHLLTGYPSFISSIDIPLDDYNNNIIHYLVIHDREEIYDMLEQRKKDLIFHRNNSCLPTTLHLAAYLGRLKFVEKLWKAGVRIEGMDISIAESTESGKTFAGTTQQTGVMDLLRLIISEGSHIKLKCIGEQSIQFGCTEDYIAISSFCNTSILDQLK